MFYFFSPFLASAASLYLSPSSGSYSVGDTFSVGVYVSSKVEAINAISADISYSKDKLEVVSISKTGSVLNLWTQEPTFSNSSGSISLEGIIFNPGYIGNNAKVVQINFKVKDAGTSLVSFSDGAVLANDGQGTNVLDGMSNANFSANKKDDKKPEASKPEASKPEVSKPEVKSPVTLVNTSNKEVPSLAKISSISHPNQDKWYNTSTAIFNWDISDSINGIKFSIAKDNKEISNDIVLPVNSKEYQNIADGVWYFNIQLKNKFGWSEISSFRFQIDTEKPSRFNINKISQDSEFISKAMFSFDAEDELSGIDYFDVKIDNGDYNIWQSFYDKNIYETPNLPLGDHMLYVNAIDKAGNFFSNSVSFTINSLEAPIITDSPRVIYSGNKLTIKGTSKYPSYNIKGWLQFEDDKPEEIIFKTDELGNFELCVDKQLTIGNYHFWVEIIDKDEIHSVLSEKIKFKVKEILIFSDIFSNSKMNIILIIIVIFIIILGLAAYIRYKYMDNCEDIIDVVYKKEREIHKKIGSIKEDYYKKNSQFSGTKNDANFNELSSLLNSFTENLDDLNKTVEDNFSHIIKKIK